MKVAGPVPFVPRDLERNRGGSEVDAELLRGLLVLDSLEQFRERHGGRIFVRRKSTTLPITIGQTNIGRPLFGRLQLTASIFGQAIEGVLLAFKDANETPAAFEDDLGFQKQGVGSIDSRQSRRLESCAVLLRLASLESRRTRRIVTWKRCGGTSPLIDKSHTF